MWFVCGLGNPGTKYQNTRHNIGFNFIDSIVKKYNFNLIKKDKSAEIFKGSIHDINFILLKPLKFMNASGPVVEKIIVEITSTPTPTPLAEIEPKQEKISEPTSETVVMEEERY